MKKTFSYKDYSVRIEGPVRDAHQGRVLKAMSVTKSPKKAKHCPCSNGAGIKGLWVLLDAKESRPLRDEYEYKKERARLLKLARQKVSQLETKLKAAIDEHLQQGHKS